MRFNSLTDLSSPLSPL